MLSQRNGKYTKSVVHTSLSRCRFYSDNTTWTVDRQFLWGKHLLITPVLDPVSQHPEHIHNIRSFKYMRSFKVYLHVLYCHIKTAHIACSEYRTSTLSRSADDADELRTHTVIHTPTHPDLQWENMTWDFLCCPPLVPLSSLFHILPLFSQP